MSNKAGWRNKQIVFDHFKGVASKRYMLSMMMNAMAANKFKRR